MFNYVILMGAVALAHEREVRAHHAHPSSAMHLFLLKCAVIALVCDNDQAFISHYLQILVLFRDVITDQLFPAAPTIW